MKKIKKEYSYSRDRQIWRLLPTETNKLIIEDRDIETKEVFFNCLEISSGKKIFYDFQLEEKYWIGIEAIYDDIIFFHKFASYDMPDHSGIIALDINSKKILWHTEEFNFLSVRDKKIFCYKNKFEGREYFILDFRTGSLISELGDNSEDVRRIMENLPDVNTYESYLFPEPYNNFNSNNSLLKQFLTELKNNHSIKGNLDFIELNELLLLNYHEVRSDGNFRNLFKVIEYLSKNVIFEMTLNENTKTLIPDSFFVKDNFLFLLIEKKELIVCSIKN